MNADRPHRSFEQPTITFHTRLSHEILQVDERIIEAADTTAQNLKEVITTHHTGIRDYIDLTESTYEAFRPSSSRRLRVVILISRLALLGQQEQALTDEAQQSGSHYFNDINVLTDEFMPYWSSVAETGFQPQVQHLRLADPQIGGVWLGIT